MKVCPSCKATYTDDANFCPQEGCATENGPQRLQMVAAEPASRYQAIARLGGHSTGEVWKARDNQTGAIVAYKIVAPEVVSSANLLARIERELKQLMKVASPRVAAVLDAGRTPDDRLYVVTESCDGESLDKILKGGPLALDRAKAVIAQVGQALLEAQKAGLVHRDVSPKNILVSPNGEVKVINFALARPINDKASGVAAYLSPEQAQGKPVDQRSNTYSLAAVLYHALTGEPPFQAATPEAILDLHISSPPLAPSQRRPEAGLSPDTDRVILKALDKNSSRRHLTLRLFLSEVETLTASASAAGAGAGAAAAGSGFARTMLFAGGQQEVASLVQKAIASRGAPAAAAPPAPAPLPVAPPVAQPARPAHTVALAAPAPTPVQSPRVGGHGGPTTVGHPGHAVSPATASNGAAVAAPSAAALEAERLSRLTPPPATPFQPVPAVTPPPQVVVPASKTPPPAAPTATALAATAAAPAPAGAEAGKAAAQAKGSAFRETLWFKKGDVEHMIAEAKAKGVPGAAPPAAAAPAAEDIRPVEDRYVDDGTVTTDDRKKFSLRTGGTATALPVAGQSMPGEKMSPEEVLAEVSGGSRKTGLVVVAVMIVVAAVVAIIAVMMKGKAAEPARAPAAAAVPAPPPPKPAPPPAPAPAAPTPSVPDPKSNAALGASPSPEVAKPAEEPQEQGKESASDDGDRPEAKSAKDGDKKRRAKPSKKEKDSKKKKRADLR